jgi:hypothetical protein
MNNWKNIILLYAINTSSAFAAESTATTAPNFITKLSIAIAIVGFFKLITGTHNAAKQKSEEYLEASQTIDKAWSCFFKIVVSIGFAVFAGLASGLIFDAVAPRATWARYGILAVMILSLAGAFYFAFRKKKGCNHDA